MAAAFYGHLEVVKYLITSGALVNKQQRSNDKWTALHYAAYPNDLEVIKYLLSKGADATIKDQTGKTPAHWTKDPAIKELLTKKRPELLIRELLSNANASESECEKIMNECPDDVHSLDLSNLNLKQLPRCLSRWPLSKLDLSGNQFTDVPDCIRQMKSLTHLNLSGNQLLSLPDWIEELNVLTDLDLSANCFEQPLPKSVLQMPTVQTITLDSQTWNLNSLNALKSDFKLMSAIGGSSSPASVFKNLAMLKRERVKFLQGDTSVASLSASLLINWMDNNPVQSFQTLDAELISLQNQIADASDAQTANNLCAQRDEKVKTCLSAAQQLIGYYESPEVQNQITQFKKVKVDQSIEPKQCSIAGYTKLQTSVVKRMNNFVTKTTKISQEAIEKTNAAVNVLSAILTEDQRMASKLCSVDPTVECDTDAFDEIEKQKQCAIFALFDAIVDERQLHSNKSMEMPSNLSKDCLKLKEMIRFLVETHEQNQRIPLTNLYSVAKRRVAELKIRLQGCPDLTPWKEARKAEKQARELYMISKIKNGDAMSDDDSDATVGDQNDLVALRKAWRAAACTLEKESFVIALAASSYFPELQFVSKKIKELVEWGPSFNSSRSHEHYDLHEKLHQQGRNDVWKASFEGKECVLKSFRLDNDQSARSFRKEVKFLRQLQHPHIVELNAAFTETYDNALKGYIEMPFYHYGDLWQWKQTVEPDEFMLKRIFRGALLGLSFVHSRNIIHSDVKPANIFVDEHHRAKLGDFDVSKDDSNRTAAMVTTVMVPTSVGFTTSYVAPELLQMNGLKASTAADVYAFGLSMFDVYFDQSENHNAPPRPSSLVVAKSTEKIVVPNNCSDDSLKEVLNNFLAMNPDDRCSCFDGLTRFKYFAAAGRGEDSAVSKQCFVCLESHLSTRGITCESGAHFQCLSCLENYFKAFARADDGVELLVASGKGVKCPVRVSEEHDEQPYDDAKLAMLLSPELFDQAMKIRARFAEQRLAAEFEVRYQARLREQEALGAVERHRQFIIERILNTACPRCNLVFQDFDGCFAVSCNRCRCSFCAWCFTDCGDDAHSHVVKCGLGNGEFYGTKEAFEECNRRRKKKAVEEYLDSLPDDALRENVVSACSRELDDLGVSISRKRRKTS